MKHFNSIRFFSRTITLSIVVMAFSTHLNAAAFTYNFSLSGLNASPTNGSPGNGLASVVIDTVANTMTIECDFDQVGSSTGATINATTATAGTGNAPRAMQLSGFPLAQNSGFYSSPGNNMAQASIYDTAFLSANGGTAALAFKALYTAIIAGKAYFQLTNSGTNWIRGYATSPACTFTDSITASLTNLDLRHGDVVMTVRPVPAGTSPTYNWYKNGTIINIHASEVSYGGALGDGDQIYCFMGSTVCGVRRVTTSNTITFTKSGSSAKDITTFKMPNQVGVSTINATGSIGTINAVVTTAPAGRVAIHPTQILISPNATYGPSYATNMNFSGTVTYTVTAQNGTTKVWQVTVVDQSGQRLEDSNDADSVSAEIKMNLYPNPASSYINVVASGGTEAAVITILDANSRVVYHQQLPASATVNHLIDVGGWSPGMYFLNIAVEDRSETRQFVVAK